MDEVPVDTRRASEQRGVRRRQGRGPLPDPAGPSAGDPLSLNRYVYAADDPVNLMDSDGREPHGFNQADGYPNDGYNYGHDASMSTMQEADDYGRETSGARNASNDTVSSSRNTRVRTEQRAIISRSQVRAQAVAYSMARAAERNSWPIHKGKTLGLSMFSWSWYTNGYLVAGTSGEQVKVWTTDKKLGEGGGTSVPGLSVGYAYYQGNGHIADGLNIGYSGFVVFGGNAGGAWSEFKNSGYHFDSDDSAVGYGLLVSFGGEWVSAR